MFADDITLIISNLISMKDTLKVLKTFQEWPGININIDQTQAKCIGSLII